MGYFRMALRVLGISACFGLFAHAQQPGSAVDLSSAQIDVLPIQTGKPLSVSLQNVHPATTHIGYRFHEHGDGPSAPILVDWSGESVLHLLTADQAGLDLVGSSIRVCALQMDVRGQLLNHGKPRDFVLATQASEPVAQTQPRLFAKQLEDQQVAPGETLRLKLNTTQTAGQPTFFIESGAPAHVFFNPSRGEFFFTPARDQAGTEHDIRFVVQTDATPSIVDKMNVKVRVVNRQIPESGFQPVSLKIRK